MTNLPDDDNYFIMEHLDTEEFMKNDDDNFTMEHLDSCEDHDDDFIDPDITSVGSWLPDMLIALTFLTIVISLIGLGIWKAIELAGML